MTDHTIPTEAQTAAAFDGPALAISNFMIHPMSGSLLRLSFVEAAFGTERFNYRTAVVLDRDGARNLADMLLRFAGPALDEKASGQ
jgi:hypothetical protein